MPKHVPNWIHTSQNETILNEAIYNEVYSDIYKTKPINDSRIVFQTKSLNKRNSSVKRFGVNQANSSSFVEKGYLSACINSMDHRLARVRRRTTIRLMAKPFAANGGPVVLPVGSAKQA